MSNQYHPHPYSYYLLLPSFPLLLLLLHHKIAPPIQLVDSVTAVLMAIMMQEMQESFYVYNAPVTRTLPQSQNQVLPIDHYTCHFSFSIQLIMLCC